MSLNSPFETLRGLKSPFGDYNWWDAYSEGGVAPVMVNDFEEDRYFNLGTKAFDDLNTQARIGTKPAWDASGNIAIIPTLTEVIKYNPVTLEREGVVAEPAKSRLNIYPECKDGTGWGDVLGSISTNLSLNALGVFDGVSVATTGGVVHRLQVLDTPSVTIGNIHPITFFYRTGTSGKARVNLVVNGIGETIIEGDVGSLSVLQSDGGTISGLTETLLSDGVTYMLTCYMTMAGTNVIFLAIGPNSTTNGETVIALGAFIGGAGEKLPSCPIVGNDGSTESIAADELSMGGVASGVELVTNSGDPFTSITGWVTADSAVLSIDIGRLKIENGAASAGDCYESIPVTVGRTYRVVTSIEDGDVVARAILESSLNAADYTTNSSTGTYTDDIVATSTTLIIRFSPGSAAINKYMFANGASIQEVLPFKGFNPAEGTFVFVGNWVHNSAANAFMIAGDTNTRFVYHSLGAPVNVSSFDGSSAISAVGVFTDNTDIAVVMSYKEGGNFNILADGSTEASAALTGDMAATVLDIGHLAGVDQMNGPVGRIIYYDQQLDLATRQGISV